MNSTQIERNRIAWGLQGMARLVEGQVEAIMAVYYGERRLSVKELTYLKAACKALSKGASLLRRLANHLEG